MRLVVDGRKWMMWLMMIRFYNVMKKEKIQPQLYTWRYAVVNVM